MLKPTPDSRTETGCSPDHQNEVSTPRYVLRFRGNGNLPTHRPVEFIHAVPARLHALKKGFCNWEGLQIMLKLFRWRILAFGAKKATWAWREAIASVAFRCKSRLIHSLPTPLPTRRNARAAVSGWDGVYGGFPKLGVPFWGSP